MKQQIRKWSFLVLLFIFCVKTNGQTNQFFKEYKSILKSIAKGKEVYKGMPLKYYSNKIKTNPDYFIDYVLRAIIQNPDSFHFISNRKNLKKLQPFFVTGHEMNLHGTIGGKNIDLSIKKKSVMIYDIKNDIVYDTIDNIIIPSRYKGQQIYGLSSDDTSATFISTCQIKYGNESYDLPDSVFGNLFFPNLLYYSENVKPIEAFVSPNRAYIYIYIFGLRENKRIGVPYHNAYMTKLIIRLKDGLAKKFTITGNVLAEYECNYANFIGF